MCIGEHLKNTEKHQGENDSDQKILLPRDNHDYHFAVFFPVF